MCIEMLIYYRGSKTEVRHLERVRFDAFGRDLGKAFRR